MSDTRVRLAWEFLRRGRQLQMQGQLELAALLYQRSISLHPTAEAHTLLGLAYRSQGRVEEAIAECKRAIAVDPALGNPYNEIGACLLDLGRPAEAVGWLEQAALSPRYETHHFAWHNLGRALAALEMYNRALECFDHALDIEPAYAPALEARDRIRRLLQ